MSKSKRLNRDHAKRKQRPMVEDRVIAEHLTALLTPTIKSQSRFFRELGLRDRILTLPLMVAAVLTLLWRDVPGVTELTRLLETEGFLWCGKIKVSQQALSQRFLSFPAILFERIFTELLPNLNLIWSTRQSGIPENPDNPVYDDEFAPGVESVAQTPTNTQLPYVWKPGDPIIEANTVVTLPDGRQFLTVAQPGSNPTVAPPQLCTRQ